MYKQTYKMAEAKQKSVQKKRAVPPKEKPDKTPKKKIPWGSILLKVFIGIVLIAGIGMVSYPTVSNWYNQNHQSRAIATHIETVEKMDDLAKQAILQDARVYNTSLVYDKSRLLITPEKTARYNQVLDPTGDGLMGYIDIDKIKVHLAIYHGTSDAVLQTGVGHLEGTSLPVGGESTHCLLSGHRGLPSATLFTHLDQLVIGDTFELHIMGDILTYQIDQIDVVLPEEVNNLTIDEGKDYVTLVTCTPYGVNSHRMLVRGTRISTPEESYDKNVSQPGTVDVAGYNVSLWPMVIVFAVILLFIIDTVRRKTIKKKTTKKNRGGKEL